MDALSEVGKQYEKHERRAAEIFTQSTGMVLRAFDRESPIRLDGIVYRGDAAVSAYELKCRNMTLDTLGVTHSMRWMLSHDKLLFAAEYAREHRLPVYGFLYLIDSDLLLTQRLCKRNGDWAVGFTVETSRTKATCNGGSAVRENAMIDMSGAVPHYGANSSWAEHYAVTEKLEARR